MIRLHVIITLSVGVVEYYIHVHVHTWKSESKLQLLLKIVKKLMTYLVFNQIITINITAVNMIVIKFILYITMKLVHIVLVTQCNILAFTIFLNVSFITEYTLDNILM